LKESCFVDIGILGFGGSGRRRPQGERRFESIGRRGKMAVTGREKKRAQPVCGRRRRDLRGAVVVGAT